ncbi:MerR family transcriptional regulator [Paenibacillus sp. S28]|uniref:MerR family transcriptional regulator n=1 Tax=Paenibacillus sp. S28 TaxID=2767463 RepID=UPI00190CF5ED|nr:MerR family transcriptional regulator [Paenibacillus sp. S28]MBJ9989399.1 MerR family transcriptional regulator [Paenibacillus sp. S28]
MNFSIKEVSERLGIPPHTIRYYEKEGLLPNIQRDPNGNRMFEQKDVDWIDIMMRLRATGMSVVTVRKMVDLTVKGDVTIPERKAILEKHKLELQRKQVELDRANEVVNKKLLIYESMMSVHIRE